MKIVTNVEIRESSKGVKRLHAVLIQEGRASTGGRSEVIIPGAITWPDAGISLRAVHRGPAIGVAHPARHPNGEIRIATLATGAVIQAVESGKTGMSIEFTALREKTTKGGIREVQAAYVDAAALVSNPEYEQGRAEIRSRKRRSQLWRL